MLGAGGRTISCHISCSSLTAANRLFNRPAVVAHLKKKLSTLIRTIIYGSKVTVTTSLNNEDQVTHMLV